MNGVLDIIHHFSLSNISIRVDMLKREDFPNDAIK